ncbi:type II secretion system GspH family protein [Oceanimonas baumannii]|uniref:PulJ/GspJ family protein n=1 Tax=Oceanimonas baumannii TaxID=129578 RepID=UPI001D17EA6D|nr:type II secretion system protein [Oceanimonas baumannii]MCC4264597.1 type II secretion system GspH family protein [Oceanimonas baumannii]
MTSKQNGFTLIELLVALAVFSMAVSLIMMGFEQGRLNWSKSIDNTSEVRKVYNRYQWIQNTFAQANTSNFSTGISEAMPYFKGDQYLLSFISNAPAISGPGTYARVEFEFKSEVSRYALVYRESINQDPYLGYYSDVEPQELVLFDNIKSYNIDYLAPPNFEDALARFRSASDIRYEPTWIKAYQADEEGLLPLSVHLEIHFTNGEVKDWFFPIPVYRVSADISADTVVM